MRALTVWQPWAWALIHGGKDLENRSWKPPADLIGKRLAIHAGKIDEHAFESLRKHLYDDPTHMPPPANDLLPKGAIIGTVRVLGWVDARDRLATQPHPRLLSAPADRAALARHPGRASKWFVGPVGWIVDPLSAFVLKDPIPCKGMLGAWHIPEPLLARIPEEAR